MATAGSSRPPARHASRVVPIFASLSTQGLDAVWVSAKAVSRFLVVAYIAVVERDLRSVSCLHTKKKMRLVIEEGERGWGWGGGTGWIDGSGALSP